MKVVCRKPWSTGSHLNYVLVAEIKALQSNLTLEQILNKEAELRLEVRHLEALFY